MPNIRQAFGPGAADLADLNADPNQIVLVQSLVKEMLEAGEQRQIGIYQMLLEDHKISALPGVISATYIMERHLKSNQNRKLLASLLTELCRNSKAGQRLLLRAGIIENPSENGRKIAEIALNALGAVEISADDARWMVAKAGEANRLEERQAVLTIYAILLGQSLHYEEALQICREWFASTYEMDDPARLMTLLLKGFPQHLENTLARLFSVIDARDKGVAQKISQFVELPGFEAVYPAIEAANARLEQAARNSRVRFIEYFMQGPVARQFVGKQDELAKASEYVLDHDMTALYRYWWQLVSQVVTSEAKLGHNFGRDYIERTLLSADDDFALWGYVQLLFMSAGTNGKSVNSVSQWAERVLNDLKMHNAEVYIEAAKLYDSITKGIRPEVTSNNPPPILDGIQ